eukprot:TRINITY_DN11712_c0_g1_i6.p1 TRINITY_DN11712_c0_g1~~TRINITY_DN11712_c0_g1_i6.p1  ORF type:complete len:306 (+),score=93.65 TRINITY_DN11712_c0_g1_i6:98-1015(+)
MLFYFFFFFFKQKTAYEMLRSLVGSEMCIRDRYQRRVRGLRTDQPMAAALRAGSHGYNWLTGTAPDQLPLRRDPTDTHTCTVIWLHGIGANAKSEFAMIHPLMERLPGVRFLIPEAPEILSRERGVWLRCWWEVGQPNLQINESQEELDRSGRQLMELVQQEVADGTPYSRIVLGGFSQGAALALYVALEVCPEPLMAVLSHSGYNALARQVFTEDGVGFVVPVHRWRRANLATPVWFGQGGFDVMIYPRWSTGHYNIIRGRGVPASLFTFTTMNHTCLLYTSDAADEEDSVDLGGRRIIKKKKK